MTIVPALRPVLATVVLAALLFLVCGLYVIHAMAPALQVGSAVLRTDKPVQVEHCLPPAWDVMYVPMPFAKTKEPMLVYRFTCGGHEWDMLPEVDPTTPEVPR